MYVYIGIMALMCMVLCSRSPDSVLSVSVRRVHVVSTTAGFNGEESRALRHKKPPRRGDASRKPRALSWVRSLAISALAHGFTH